MDEFILRLVELPGTVNAVTVLDDNGANLMVVADLIGDTVEQVMKTYGHMYESDKIKIVESIS